MKKILSLVIVLSMLLSSVHVFGAAVSAQIPPNINTTTFYIKPGREKPLSVAVDHAAAEFPLAVR
jgi:hypothetical protein